MEQTLGKRIVSHRKRMGLTQDQLAEKLGITAQAVSKWENDQSCPDITMLPRLAEIFGTTSDALLGMDSRVHQAEVVCPEEKEPDGVHVQSGNWEFHYDAGSWSRVGFAVWVLLTGGLLLSSNLLGWDAGFWDILWPSALTVFGLWGLLRRFSFFRLGIACLGGWLLLSNLGFAPSVLRKELLLPIFILLFGLSLLADALGKKKKPSFRFTRTNGSSKEKKHTTTLEQEGDFFRSSASFGEDTHRIDLKTLARGEASVEFGELTVDLTNCTAISKDCFIDAECAFGTLVFLVPQRFQAVPANHCAFASVEVSGHPDAAPQGVIHMDCDASFGSIEIRYI